MLTRKSHREVLIAKDNIVTLRYSHIVSLKKKALQTPRKRIRLCMHKTTDDLLHEMMIVHTKETYVRPHKHMKRVESIFIVEGRADIVIFDNSGRIDQVIRMGTYESGRTFYYRIDDPVYHSMIITSENLVFHEVTNGPFDPRETVFAPWSPPEENHQAVSAYLAMLTEKIRKNT